MIILILFGLGKSYFKNVIEPELIIFRKTLKRVIYMDERRNE